MNGLRWTREQYDDFTKRRGLTASPDAVDTSMPPFMPPPNEAGRFALGRLPTGTLNKTEAAYDAII
jgi:hypothetical protein